MSPRGDLAAAHRGYLYQDLTTAYSLAEVLAGGSGSVTVDRKVIPGDVFDDLSHRGPDGLVRRQIKWSTEGARTLKLEDFVGDRSRVRIDHLVRSYLQTPPHERAREYRLAVAWNSPTDPELLRLLRPTDDNPAIPGSATRRFRFAIDRVWPEDGVPVLQPLANSPEISRRGFLDFAERFILETDTPPFSADLSRPGELERLLLRLLVERVGIGEYPNDRRTPEDVAARLIALAAAARTEHATLTAREIAHVIDLRVDYGRVAQRFPIQAEHRVERQQIRAVLRRAIEENQVVTLVGGPGSGKSWELSALADELREEGVLVARHYCYLEPGDPDVERRITTNVLLGNLVGEMLDADPTLAEAKQRTYAATLDELERLLRTAAERNAPGPVVVIVDGIDHISRVLAQSQNVRRGDTDIVEELAALSLPTGVRLVLGSQPGAHLEPLRGLALEVEMPRWDTDEIWALATRFDLPARLQAVGQNLEEVRVRLSDRAEGNPLYATFLVRGLVEEIERGEVLPIEWLEAAPPLEGNIANYYRYLYTGGTQDARIVAEVLGVVDFAVTEEELGEIVGPQVKRHLPAVLRRLRPILIDVTGQGGLRIFHESFRRFVTEMLREDGLSVDVPLASVIDWLEALRFEENAKAYRYLLPALRRTGRVDELLAHVGPDFLSRGVAGGHPRPAIERNLALATECAGEYQRWPELVRCSELHRALHTCFEEHFLDPLPYWRAYLAVFGADVAAARLVFDGRPILDRHLGLVLCSLIDDAGVVAPWDEYLALPPQPFRETGGASVDSRWVGEVIAAILHGQFRSRGETAALAWAEEILADAGEVDWPIVARLADRLALSASTTQLERLVTSDAIPESRRAAVLLTRARRFRTQGRTAEARQYAERAAATAPSLRVAAEALTLGAERLPDQLSIPDLDELAIGLAGKAYHVDAAPVATWVLVVSVLAHTDPARLQDLMRAVEGDGWYRSWLRYVLQISQAEVVARVDSAAASTAAVEAFRELARDAHPFTGRPRAVDLVMMGGTIRETLARGLALLTGQEHWEAALSALEAAIQGTTSHFQGSFWGPIGREAIPGLLEPHSAVGPDLRERIRTAVEAQIREAEGTGEYFATHADLAFAAIRTLVSIGDRERALEHWRAAAVYLGGYGQRKDATFYQLLEAVPALNGVDARLDAVERLFPLAGAVVAHTDGKGTRDVVNACVRELAAADPGAALTLAAKSQVAGGGRFGWRTEEAAEDALGAAAEAGADPWLVALGQSTLRFAVEYEPDVLTDVLRRFKPVDRVGASDPGAAAFALRRLAARVEGDHKRDLPAAWPPIAELAGRQGVRLTSPTSAVGPEAESPDRGGRESLSYGTARTRSLLEAVDPVTGPPPNPTPLQLMAWVREAARMGPERTAPIDRIVNQVGYACIDLMQGGRADVAVRLLRYTSRQLRMYDENGAQPLADLGSGFERYSERRLAAVAFTLAFVRSRGGRGWDSFGGDEHAHWLERALVLDAVEAKRTLASEAGQVVQGGYVMGVTPGLIKRISSWGEPEVAQAAWDEAYAVVKHRLPTVGDNATTILPFRCAEDELWSVAEALVALIIARVSHPELDRKRSSLLALSFAIQDRPDAVARPLSRILSVDGAPTSTMLLLHTLLEAEAEPYPITREISPILALAARSEHWGERVIARMLLARAGLAVPGGRDPDAPPLDRPVTPQRKKAALQLDWGDRVEAIAGLWPEFPAVAARQFERLYFENEASKERWRHRYDFARRRESSMEFWTAILGWEKELFECALHVAFNGLRPHLWSQGESTVGLDDEVFARVAPALRLQLAVEASRSVRPRNPRPLEARDGAEDVPVLPSEDEYEGWRRLGWYERELVFDYWMHWGNPKEIAHLAAGVLSLGPGERAHATDPFGACPDAGLWLLPSPRPAGHSRPLPFPMGFRGRVVGAVRLDDLLGDRLVLVPPAQFASRYELHAGPWPGPLAWVDGEGKRALVLRTWRVRSINDGEEPSVLEGCEMIVRPDVYERILRDTAGKLTLVGRAWRQEIEPMAREDD